MAKKSQDTWNLYSFVMRGKNRRLVLKSLTKPQTPTSIKENTRLGIKVVSRVLKEFNAKGIVECKTPNQKLGKVYVLSAKGKKVVELSNVG